MYNENSGRFIDKKGEFDLLNGLLFFSRHVMLFPGWGGCRRSAGRPGAEWPAPAAKQLARIGRYRDMQLAEPTRWADQEWQLEQRPVENGEPFGQRTCRRQRCTLPDRLQVDTRGRSELERGHWWVWRGSMPCSAARTSWFCQRCTASSASSISNSK